MRRATFSLFITLFASLPIRQGLSQTCRGYPSFASGSTQATAQASFGESSKGFALGLSFGSRTAFGGASIGAISYDDLDGSTTVLGAEAGYQVPLNTTSTVQLCPMVSGSIGMGPKDINGSGIDASSRDASFSLSIGGLLGGQEGFRANPMIGAGFVYSSVKLEGFGDEVTESDTYGAVEFGLGLIINKTLSLRPSVTIPVGLEGADPVMSFAVALNFGNR